MALCTTSQTQTSPLMAPLSWLWVPHWEGRKASPRGGIREQEVSGGAWRKILKDGGM